MEELFGQDEINKLINGAFEREPTELRRRFDSRLEYLDISFNQARENLGLTYRALNGILDGILEQVDMLALIKIAQFLELPDSEAAKLYTDALIKKNKDIINESAKRTFILNNFDLPSLKSSGIIDSIRDFESIERQLNDFLGLDQILDFNSDESGVAYWKGNAKAPKDNKARKLFIGRSKSILKLIDNPFDYNPNELIQYFPKIRWQCLDLEHGLITVMQSLFKLGITVLFLPKITSLHLRGATLAVNNKPCIVLTDYRGYYPTIWYALLHELFHVIFDWEKVSREKYHLSFDCEETDREIEANEFAKDYFIPDKIDKAFEHIQDRAFIRAFALENQIHPSLIYGHYAYIHSTKDNNLWKRFNSQKLFPQFSSLVKKLTGNCDNSTKPISYAAHYTLNIYNEY